MLVLGMVGMLMLGAFIFRGNGTVYPVLPVRHLRNELMSSQMIEAHDAMTPVLGNPTLND